MQHGEAGGAVPRAVIQRDRSGIKIQISVALWLREFVAGARINKTMAHKLRTIGRGIKEAAAGLVDVPAFSLYFKHLVTNMLDEPPSHRNKEGYMKDDVLVHTYEKKTELRIQPAQRLIAFSTWPGMLRASNRRSEKFQFPLLSGRASERASERSFSFLPANDVENASLSEERKICQSILRTACLSASRRTS